MPSDCLPTVLLPSSKHSRPFLLLPPPHCSPISADNVVSHVQRVPIRHVKRWQPYIVSTPLPTRHCPPDAVPRGSAFPSPMLPHSAD
jgi:hypothetical protein